MTKNKSELLYNQLSKTRFQIIAPLLFITILGYFIFIGVIAFSPSIFGQLITGLNISIGILLGFLLILLIFFVTLIYVYLANKKLQPLIEKIKND